MRAHHGHRATCGEIVTTGPGGQRLGIVGHCVYWIGQRVLSAGHRVLTSDRRSIAPGSESPAPGNAYSPSGTACDWRAPGRRCRALRGLRVGQLVSVAGHRVDRSKGIRRDGRTLGRRGRALRVARRALRGHGRAPGRGRRTFRGLRRALGFPRRAPSIRRRALRFDRRATRLLRRALRVARRALRRHRRAARRIRGAGGRGDRAAGVHGRAASVHRRAPRGRRLALGDGGWAMGVDDRTDRRLDVAYGGQCHLLDPRFRAGRGVLAGVKPRSTPGRPRQDQHGRNITQPYLAHHMPPFFPSIALAGD